MAEMNKTLQRGFSLVEILIVLSIIMVIMSLVVPGLSKVFGRKDAAMTKHTLKLVNQAILDYKLDTHIYPEKLDNLMRRPENIHGWNGPYLDEKIIVDGDVLDAWQQPIVYKKSERGAKRPYELYSVGNPEKEEEKIEA